MTRVLIVDDNDENLYYLGALLRGSGYEVIAARDGAEALDRAREAPPVLVISDLLMPVMDGYTLLRHWKADESLSRVPFVVYTATYTTPEDEAVARFLGADAFILKPTEPEAFIARVRSVLDGALATGTATPHKPSVGNEEQLRGYSAALFRKLVQRTLQLEASNRKLQADVVARERAEHALRESEARFRQLAENIDEVFWLSDPEKRQMFYASPAYETIWGHSCASLYAAPGSWLDSVHPDDQQRVAASLPEQVLGTWDETYRIVRPDGSIRWIRARAYPVRDSSGVVSRVAGVSRDVTEYRRLEEQFRQAQKMEAVGRLAGGIAHDFNNVLSVILSYTSLVLRDLRAGTRIHSDIQEVHRAGERATDLTRQLLAFSRQQVLEPKVLDLGEAVRDMERLLGRLLGADVAVELLGTDTGAKIHADPSQIEQILLNLAVNARDAMPRGGKLTVEVTRVDLDATFVAAHPEVGPGPYVELAVTDTGVGIDAATQERIFEPFFTTKAVGKGTGLGLSTVFGIVSQSHGHIFVESEPGAYTRFRILLPSTDRAIDVAEPVPAAPTTLRGTETVLLVEDDEQVRLMNREILERNGYTVLDARDGSEAERVSDAFGGPIHLLVTDLVMPQLSGRELAERLAPSRPAMKVLFVSGYAEDTIDAHDVLEAGISFLQKPITPEAFLGKLRTVLAGD